ncbi:ABC transporter permease [Pseudogemmobacter faecipullorum]|uniref:ABC transporter permease n=1 Tax=Pseudogemmobacter faecipullorum TaxID=2755041 RepID=A0ABS8CKR4_9RHOB|nr:ABC transporter permease [Pseudogemmobacter faecipullorum]MCB5409946.1 ABC transporter permease [Pseudogemmobacter faecipullorum]
MLRRILIFCLVSACFAVTLANRIITAAATEGFELRIRASLYHEAIMTFPMLFAQKVSRGHADADHIGQWMEEGLTAAFAGEEISVSPYSRQFSLVAELPDAGMVEIMTTDPHFPFAYRLGLSPDGPAEPGSCLIGRSLADQLQGQMPGWLHFGTTRCRLAGVFDGEIRPPFWTLDRAVLRLVARDRIMAEETIIWSSYLHAALSPLSESDLRAYLADWLEDEPIEIWSSRHHAGRAADVLAIYNFVSASIGGIALALCAFAIATTFMFSVSEQRREIAIRRAIGATQWQIIGHIQTEIAIVVLAGLLTGICGGRYLGYSLITIMQKAALLAPTVHAVVSPADLLQLAVIFLAVGILGGLAPAITAARIDPAIVLRGS